MLKFYFLLGCLLLTACAKPIETGPSLTELSRNFSEAMRWQDYLGAANHLEPELREEFLAHFRKDDDLHAVDSKIISVELDAAAENATIEYELEYYRLPSMRVKKWLWMQEWQLQRHDGLKTSLWRIVASPPSLP